MTRVVAPSGEQFEISGGGYRAVVTECGAGLRLLDHRRSERHPGIWGGSHAGGVSPGAGGGSLPHRTCGRCPAWTGGPGVGARASGPVC